MKHYMGFLFSDKSKQNTDPWWRIHKLVDEFNKNRKENVWCSYLKVLDELMSAYQPQTLRTCNLPHLSSVLRKPEPLGSEFKCVADSVTNIMLHIELQKGKEAMKAEKYASSKKATCACVLRMGESTSRRHNIDVDKKPCGAPTETFMGNEVEGPSLYWCCEDKSFRIPKSMAGRKNERLSIRITSCSFYNYKGGN
jgi:hypothetical protein